MVLVQVAGGDDLGVVKAEQLARVAGALHAPADDAHDDTLGGAFAPILAKGAGRDNGRGGQGQGGGGEETAAADA